MSNAYKDRKARKRDFRKLWITRISAGARMNDMTYSTFMNGLRCANIEINRKMLADLAVQDMPAFARLVDRAREALVK
jgi:large subunit ribosomal protein L20